MKRVFVDTNVVLDFLLTRHPHANSSQQLFSMADRGEVDITVSSLSLVNVHDILYGSCKIKTARSIIAKFKVLVTTHELNDKIIDLALYDTAFSDFEDGVQYYTALEAVCDVLVTRDLRGFKSSAIPVMTTEQVIGHFLAH